MSFTIQFPSDEPEPVVETGLMVRTVRRTMAVHRGGALVVWSGPSRAGKTLTAQWMVAKIDAAYDTSPHAFRAKHYEVGEVTIHSKEEMKRGVQSLYTAVVGRMSEATYRQLTIEEMAALLVHNLVSRNIQMILIDEAGLLTLKAIRGMVFVRDAAELQGWRLTLVFIGMDDLPIKMGRLDQVKNRVHEWCYFEPYALAETHALLAALHPHFAALDLRCPAHHAQVDFIHRQYGGLPGLIVPFLRRLRYREAELTMDQGTPGAPPAAVPVDLDFLRAVHLLTDRDEQRAIKDAARAYVGSAATPAIGAGVLPLAVGAAGAARVGRAARRAATRGARDTRRSGAAVTPPEGA